MDMTNLNGYLVPKMAMKETHRPPVGRIGLQREKFLQENHSLLYDKMLLDGTLYSDLKQTEQRYWEQVEQTITKLLVSNPAPDKNNDPLGWTAHMNSLQAQAAELAMESTKKNWPPVYYQTGRYAREHEELPQYRASMKLNEECRDEIDDAISYNYNGLCLDDGAVQQVLAGYGAERTRYIVAAAIQVRDGDARISPQNRRWADSVRTIQDINADGYDKAVYYANLQSHAGLIDIFTSRLRQLEREKTAPER